jgi:hypothetical protein
MELEETLHQLKARRKAKRLHSLWPTIEQKLAEGVSHAEILGLLNECGFVITERTYKSYLYRYRKRRRATGRQHALSHPSDARLASAEMAPARTVSARGQTENSKRPPTFEYDPCGISPELLK